MKPARSEELLRAAVPLPPTRLQPPAHLHPRRRAILQRNVAGIAVPLVSTVQEAHAELGPGYSHDLSAQPVAVPDPHRRPYGRMGRCQGSAEGRRHLSHSLCAPRKAYRLIRHSPTACRALPEGSES